MPLIDWSDVNGRYPETLKLADATQANSSWVPYAISELNAKLSSRFTVPFSENNMTAKDLAIDMAFARVYRYKDSEKAKAVTEYVNEQISDLLSGKMSMMTSSGESVSGTGGLFYSTTENYHNVHGIGPIEYSVPSSAQIRNEESDRGRL